MSNRMPEQGEMDGSTRLIDFDKRQLKNYFSLVCVSFWDMLPKYVFKKVT